MWLIQGIKVQCVIEGIDNNKYLKIEIDEGCTETKISSKILSTDNILFTDSNNIYKQCNKEYFIVKKVKKICETCLKKKKINKCRFQAKNLRDKNKTKKISKNESVDISLSM